MKTKNKRKKTAVFYFLFLVAITMGTGPGILLVNDPERARTIFGFPTLYAWVIFWYLVMTGLIIGAYHTIWKDSSKP